MPEPLVHHTGGFVFAHVQAVETSVGRTLCPIRLWRRIQARIQTRIQTWGRRSP
jgi:hypothetical protein